MAPANQASIAIVPMLRGLLFATGTTPYWHMQPVSPWDAWFHSTPLTQMLIRPGYIATFWHPIDAEASMQSDGVVFVEYSPTTWYHVAAWIRLATGCQSAAEPRPAPGLNTYADSRLGRLSAVLVSYIRASH